MSFEGREFKIKGWSMVRFCPGCMAVVMSEARLCELYQDFKDMPDLEGLESLLKRTADEVGIPLMAIFDPGDCVEALLLDRRLTVYPLCGRCSKPFVAGDKKFIDKIEFNLAMVRRKTKWAKPY